MPSQGWLVLWHLMAQERLGLFSTVESAFPEREAAAVVVPPLFSM